MNREIEKATEALRAAIPGAVMDPLRPRFHFLPPANWMSDPNGTIFVRGEYHLFYQLNPYRAKWGGIHWGHARSRDLVHWEHLPIALAPAKHLGEKYCFSGCCVEVEGQPMIFYTSIGDRLGRFRAKRRVEQWMASGDESLCEWQRSPDNPALDQSLHGEQEICNWRDPYVWREEDGWFMLLVGKYSGEPCGSTFLYRSADLKDWEFMGRMCQGDRSLGKKWECANMVRLGDRHMLVISTSTPQVRYALGRLTDYRFRPDRWLALDHGPTFYATNTFVDDKGGYVLVGWIPVRGNGHWWGCLSLPRRITLDATDEVRMEPTKALEGLRGERIRVGGSISLTGNRSDGESMVVRDNCLEILARYTLAEGAKVGFSLQDDDRARVILFDSSNSRFRCLDDKGVLQRVKNPQQLCLHIYIDHSVVEVFINYQEAFTTWFRPRLRKGKRLRIRPILDGEELDYEIDVWRLSRNGVVDLGTWG